MVFQDFLANKNYQGCDEKKLYTQFLFCFSLPSKISSKNWKKILDHGITGENVGAHGQGGKVGKEKKYQMKYYAMRDYTGKVIQWKDYR